MTALLEDGSYHTLEEYLALEDASETKHEYLGGYVFARPGACREHNYIAANLVCFLGHQLLGKDCAVLGSDQRLRLSLQDRTYCYYPDLTVDCSAMRTLDTEEPTVLIEITSPSTARADNGDKLLTYRSLPSMRVYVLIDQSRPHLVIHRRAVDGTWGREILTGLVATLALPEIDCALAVREIYDRVEFQNASAT